VTFQLLACLDQEHFQAVEYFVCTAQADSFQDSLERHHEQP